MAEVSERVGRAALGVQRDGVGLEPPETPHGGGTGVRNQPCCRGSASGTPAIASRRLAELLQLRHLGHGVIVPGSRRSRAERLRLYRDGPSATARLPLPQPAKRARARLRRWIIPAIGSVTPVGLIVVNIAVFIVKHLAAFRWSITILAFASGMMLNSWIGLKIYRIFQQRPRNIPLGLRGQPGRGAHRRHGGDHRRSFVTALFCSWVSPTAHPPQRHHLPHRSSRHLRPLRPAVHLPACARPGERQGGGRAAASALNDGPAAPGAPSATMGSALPHKLPSGAADLAQVWGWRRLPAPDTITRQMRGQRSRTKPAASIRQGIALEGGPSP